MTPLIATLAVLLALSLALALRQRAELIRLRIERRLASRSPGSWAAFHDRPQGDRGWPLR